MDIFAEDTDPSRDLPSIRKIEVSEGSPFLIERRDPYGFWYVRREHGQVPVKLQGAYTNFEQATLAVKVYMNEKKKHDEQSPQVTNRNRSPREQGSVVGK
jgi:hypothetical protein